MDLWSEVALFVDFWTPSEGIWVSMPLLLRIMHSLRDRSCEGLHELNIDKHDVPSDAGDIEVEAKHIIIVWSICKEAIAIMPTVHIGKKVCKVPLSR